MKNSLRKRNMGKALKRFFAVCFSIMLFAVAYAENTQASVTDSPIVYLCGIKKYNDDSGFDDTIYFSELESLYRRGNSDAIVVQKDYFESFSNLEEMLTLGNFVWITTHGLNGYIATFDSDGNINGRIDYTDFFKYSDKKFSNVELCVVLACESAAGAMNVSAAICAKGAKCTIGFRESIEAVRAREWQRYFVKAQMNGWTVAAAVRYADSQVYDESCKGQGDLMAYGWLNTHVVYGNSNVRY